MCVCVSTREMKSRLNYFLAIIFCTGERVTLKDNTPVYSLGNSLESSLIVLNKSPKKVLLVVCRATAL